MAAKKEITEKEILDASTRISDALNYLKENELNFKRIEKKFDTQFQRLFFIMENDSKTGTIGVVQRVADLEKWKLEIDYLLANLKGQVVAYSAAAVFILYLLGQLMKWIFKVVPVKTIL